MSNRYVVVGAGGQAKVVIATIQAAGGAVVRVLDDSDELRGRAILGCVIDGPISADLVPSGAQVVLGLGRNANRKEMSARLPVDFGVVVHPHSWVHGSVTLGPGTVVFAGAIIQPDVRIGGHVIVNTGASIDHDCVIGDFVHVAPGVHLAGDVRLEEGAFMGIGSSAVPGARVRAWATVGAGGIVLGEIPSRAVFVGVPARPIQNRRARA